MAFIIQCSCGQQMTVQDTDTGRVAMCVGCKQSITVPPKPANPSSVVSVTPVTSSGSPQPPPGGPQYGQPSPGQPGYTGGYPTWYKPHRGGLVLGLGITGIVCCCCCINVPPALAAIIMGAIDLSEMNAGKMDPSGKGMTIAGIVCGCLGLLLTLGSSLFNGFGSMNRFDPSQFEQFMPKGV